MRGFLKRYHMEDNQPPHPEPEHIMKAIEMVDSISEQIRKREADCLKSVFTRFCLIKFKTLDPSQVDIKNYPVRPNFTNYYYKFGTHEQYWLMSTELIIEDNEPKLNVLFNAELVNNNEL